MKIVYVVHLTVQDFIPIDKNIIKTEVYANQQIAYQSLIPPVEKSIE